MQKNGWSSLFQKLYVTVQYLDVDTLEKNWHEPKFFFRIRNNGSESHTVWHACIDIYTIKVGSCRFDLNVLRSPRMSFHDKIWISEKMEALFSCRSIARHRLCLNKDAKRRGPRLPHIKLVIKMDIGIKKLTWNTHISPCNPNASLILLSHLQN